MKPTNWKILVPLTLVTMATVSKWWYVLPVDSVDTMMTGWPLPFVCAGWHTSLSYQIFVAELAIDAICYLGLVALALYVLQRWLAVTVGKRTRVALWVLSALLMGLPLLMASNSNNLYYMHRDWDMQVIATGPELVYWPHERPAFPDSLRPHP